MKKIILTLALALGLTAATQAQVASKNALGIRFGDNDGFGAELSYQRKLSTANRLELDLGIRNNDNYDSFKLTGLYQWVWNIEGGFDWFAGFGGGLGTFDNKKFDNDGTFAFVAGSLGVEYNFDVPVQIALDIRPELYFNNNFRDDNFGPDVALAIRYRF